MSSQHIALAEALMDVEKELRELRLWSATPPSAEALASQQPFAVDTLDFHQWLQFIFIPRFHAMIQSGARLPAGCGVAPMAEQVFQSAGLHTGPLIAHLQRIDILLTSDGTRAD